MRSFYREAKTRLEHHTVWFEDTHRTVIADAFARVKADKRYTCFACAILSNHAHPVIRKHRDHAEDMIIALKRASVQSLRSSRLVPEDHPVWSSDLFKRFLSTGDDVRRVVRYVINNPLKEGLARQSFPFIKEYREEWDRS